MKIFVLDEQPLLREAIGALMRRLAPTITLIELDRLSAVMPTFQVHGAPELICLDLHLPDASGVSGVRLLRQQFPEASIVVLTAESAVDYRDLSLEAGASAFLPKSATTSQITEGLRTFLIQENVDEVSAPIEKLSKRQKQLLVLLDKGMSNRDIAETLQISEHTVKVHLWRLFRRLNVKSRSQASHLARIKGLL